MQGTIRYSLNAVRVFEAVARHGSIKNAAEELNVTASAVSHQIKGLEEDLGVALFERGNNTIGLNTGGRQFYEDIVPGLSIIEKSASSLQRQSSELVLRASISLATRWLIPALESYKQENPDALVRLETTHDVDVRSAPHIDLTITYVRPGSNAPDGTRLFRDFSRPVASPVLLSTVAYNGLNDLGKVPAIQATKSNWDWRLWANFAGIAFEDIRLGDAVDTDDIAIHGAVARMGMALMPNFLTRREIASGSLVELPGTMPVETGQYYILASPRERGVARKLRNWLIREAASN